MNIYVADGWQTLVLILGAVALVFLVVAGVCAHVNLVAGRRVLRPGGPPTAATAKELGRAVKCARGTARRRAAFWLLVEMEGTDSWVATGLLARSDGQIQTFRYDSDPSGGSGLPPRFSVNPCERLTSSETPSITQVTCTEPRDSP